MAHCNVCATSLAYFRRKSSCSRCRANVCRRCCVNVTTTNAELSPVATKNVRIKMCLGCISTHKTPSKPSLAARIPILLDLAIESTPKVAEPVPSPKPFFTMDASGADTPEKMQQLMARLLSVQHTTEHIISTTMQLSSPVA
ncbi:hypothetical protein SPRG_04535 [Saprolegnia parasitica CBS 223.65]|uniref:FYVE-type domain-containing protein n=1 Tax=Saprolegnia parasitica (strain CBS 223.65) TaxID=695850 RepID=A0A067CIS9_SAPPC|nr:hypothetical protein SPRG_04535 [Saprolegnia parasitica CBS 223.65]KDO30634.1 hypothetical protein SPRG_04535 [Saprolegnia parasitica CBS 223.65]|eukprot:XP_012198845.1 hypothetical protein SPRG_04535 [Saprolegnia parasitica CBS 223.65]